jgi:hypothetical protein
MNDLFKRAEYREAYAIITAALEPSSSRLGSHAQDCPAFIFARKNQMLPPSHPVWKQMPPCSCWVGWAKRWLAKNP